MPISHPSFFYPLVRFSEPIHFFSSSSQAGPICRCVGRRPSRDSGLICLLIPWVYSKGCALQNVVKLYDVRRSGSQRRRSKPCEIRKNSG